MKRFSKSVILTAVACLIAGNSATFAQKKSGGNGGSRNFGNIRSAFSAGQQSSGQFRSISSGSGNSMSGQILQTGGINSGKGGGSVSRIGNTGLSSNGLGIQFGPPSRSTNTFPTLNGATNSSTNLPRKLQNSSSGSLPQLNINSIGKGKLTPLNKPTSNLTLPWKPKPGNGGITTVPFLPKGSGTNGNNNQISSGQQSVSVGSQTNWKQGLQQLLAHNHHHWCHTRPATCHWWTQYCEPIAHCHHNELVICDWNRVHCSTVVVVGRPAQEVQWYLGLKGILLPGKGIGIDAVEANSPAAQIGLQPGMVITVCNGIALVDETSMQEAIRISGGVLQMTLLSADGSQVLEGVAVMSRVAVVNF